MQHNTSGRLRMLIKLDLSTIMSVLQTGASGIKIGSVVVKILKEEIRLDI